MKLLLEALTKAYTDRALLLMTAPIEHSAGIAPNIVNFVFISEGKDELADFMDKYNEMLEK